MENMRKGGAEMDELYTIEEMMSRLKVSRDTVYNYMDQGILPFVKIGGQRRFIGSQVMKAIKTMQVRQLQEAGRSKTNVPFYTLSDVKDLSALDSKPSKNKISSRKNSCPSKKKTARSKRLKKRSYNSKTV